MNAADAVRIACDRVARLLQAMPAPAAWLSPEEGARLQAIAGAARRDQFLAARWQARQLLAGAAGGLPQDWRLSAPEAAPPTVIGQPHWHLSISHSGGWAACALAPRPVGFDLEAPRRKRDIAGLVALCCTAREQRAFQDLDAAARADLFHELWTVKESWLKRRGAWIAPRRLVCIDAQPAAEGEVRTWRGEGWVAALCGAGQVQWAADAPAPLRTWSITDT